MVRIESKQPRKQRKARYNAPAHLRGKFISAPLSPALRTQYKRRTLRVVKGDTVKLLRGDSIPEDRLALSRGFRSQRQTVPKFHGLSIHQMSR
jgi:large subunit ribosomal protein L24